MPIELSRNTFSVIYSDHLKLETTDVIGRALVFFSWIVLVYAGFRMSMNVCHCQRISNESMQKG